jgi:hypothetical protein
MQRRRESQRAVALLNARLSFYDPRRARRRFRHRHTQDRQIPIHSLAASPIPRGSRCVATHYGLESREFFGRLPSIRKFVGIPGWNPL